MKSGIKTTSFIALLLLCSAVWAQGNSSGVNLSTASFFDIPNMYVVGDESGYQDLFQSYDFYSNPEINKLETEISQLSRLYRRDQYNRKESFSSDKYKDLTENEKKELRNSLLEYRFGAEISYTRERRKEKDTEKDKTTEQRAEEYFNNLVAPYLNADKSLNKQKISDEIKKKLNAAFELKEQEKQKKVTKLEEDLRTAQNALTERKKNKQQIMEQRMNDLVGLPNTLKW